MRKLPIILFAASMVEMPLALAQSGAGQHSPSRPSASRSATAKSAAGSTASTKNSSSTQARSPAPMTDEQKTIYAVGLSIYQSLSPLALSPSELTIVQQALTDAAADKPAVDLKTWGPKIQAFAQSRAPRFAEHQKAIAEQQKAASQAYLDKAATESGAQKTASGLIYRELRPGTGASPKATDTVKVNYRGTLVSGEEFDSSYSRHEPTQFPLNGVVPCWTEGLQLMKKGGKAQLVCPANLAYGDQGRPGIPPGATLVFEIELLDIVGAAQ